MSLGPTSNPECGPTFPWMAFFSSHEHRLSPCRAMPGEGTGRAGPSCPAGRASPQVDSAASAGTWGSRMKGWSGGGGSASGTHCQRGQLVNFVGMHLVERRCINIRSLSAYCVSHLGGGGAGGPQMPFVKKKRMASRRPWKVAAGPRQSSGSGLRAWGGQR